MAASPIKLRVGTISGSNLRAEMAPVRAAVTKAVAQATIRRVQRRTSYHPAAMTLRARGINQWQAEIRGSRGGPGIIRPVRAKALVFVWHGSLRFFNSVRGVGLGPLIEAEALRVETRNINTQDIEIHHR